MCIYIHYVIVILTCYSLKKICYSVLFGSVFQSPISPQDRTDQKPRKSTEKPPSISVHRRPSVVAVCGGIILGGIVVKVQLYLRIELFSYKMFVEKLHSEKCTSLAVLHSASDNFSHNYNLIYPSPALII